MKADLHWRALLFHLAENFHLVLKHCIPQLPTIDSCFVDGTAFSATFHASGPAAVELTTKLNNIHTITIHCNFYLTSATLIIMCHVQWMPNDNSNIVVDKEAANTTMEVCAAWQHRMWVNSQVTWTQTHG